VFILTMIMEIGLICSNLIENSHHSSNPGQISAKSATAIETGISSGFDELFSAQTIAQQTSAASAKDIF
jgi:hypothetical protein